MVDRRRRAAALALLFLAAFAGFLALVNRFPVLYDADSYFQLAVARSYAEEGVRRGLPWARFSILSEGFGDKDVLFHLLLVPFAAWMEPLAGGRIAIALINAALVTVLAAGAWRVAGARALVVPLWVYVTAVPLFFRLNRLRPEGFALLLLLAAAAAAIRGRYRLLGAIALLFALSYTAIQALLGLCLLWMVAEGWRSRRWQPKLLLYPVLGAGLGLMIHPQFPANLDVWVHTNVLLPIHGRALDVGSEYMAMSTRELLFSHLGWWAGLLVIWRSCEPAAATDGSRRPERAALYLAVAALAFGGLYLLMGRFATFFVPFATLALFGELERRGLRLGRWTRLPWRGRVPFAAAFGLCLTLGLPETVQTTTRLIVGDREGIPLEVDRRAFGAAVPEGAKVAASWGSAEWYTFFAPQGRYLNVLDPIFMAVPHAELYARQLALFRNLEPDPPLVTAVLLESDFLAVNRFESPQALVDRLLADPRVRLRYGGYHLLAEVLPDANGDFLLDWRLLPPAVPLPPPAEAIESAPAYPRLSPAAGGRYEGYVDGRRFAATRGCVGFARREVVTEPTEICYEFAPAGPSRLWIDGRPRLASLSGTGAELGSGLLLDERLETGEHTLAVESCAVDGAAPQLGFYLLERLRRPATAGSGPPCAEAGIAPGAPIRPLASAPAGPG